MSEYKDREQTKQFMLNVTKQVLNINWLEQLRATLNYAPVLVIRELPKLCEAPKEPPVVETIWKGTYIKLLDVNNLFHINYSTLHPNNLIANPIEYLICYRQEDTFDNSEVPEWLGGYESGYEGYGGGSEKIPLWEAIHSLIDVNDNVYDITSYGSATTIETDFMLNGKLLTMDDLTKGIKGQFIADTNNSTTQFKTYSRFYGGDYFNNNNWDARPEALYAGYSSFIGFYGLENEAITINDTPIAEFNHDKLTINRKSDRTAIYYNADDGESLFLKIGSSANELTTYVYGYNPLNKAIYISDTYSHNSITSTIPMTVRLYKPDNLEYIKAFLDQTNGNQGSGNGSDTTNPDTPPPIPPESESPSKINTACSHDDKHPYFTVQNDNETVVIPVNADTFIAWFVRLGTEQQRQDIASAYGVEWKEPYWNARQLVHEAFRLNKINNTNLVGLIDNLKQYAINEKTHRGELSARRHFPYSTGNKFDVIKDNPCEKGYYRTADGLCAVDFTYCNSLYQITNVHLRATGFNGWHRAWEEIRDVKVSDYLDVTLDYISNGLYRLTFTRKDVSNISFHYDYTVTAEDIQDFIRFKYNEFYKDRPSHNVYLKSWETVLKVHPADYADYVQSETDNPRYPLNVLGMKKATSYGNQYIYYGYSKEQIQTNSFDNRSNHWVATAEEACSLVAKSEYWHRHHEYDAEPHQTNGTVIQCRINKGDELDLGKPTQHAIELRERIELTGISFYKLYPELISKIDVENDEFIKKEFTEAVKHILYEHVEVDYLLDAINRGYYD